MNRSFLPPLARVVLFWYVLGALVLFLGLPEWAEVRYTQLAQLPWVPELELHGLSGAASVQWVLLSYWSVPLFATWALLALGGVAVAEVRYRFAVQERSLRLKPRGAFWGVQVSAISLGDLPTATTPGLTGNRVAFATPETAVPAHTVAVSVGGPVKEALKMLTATERQLCEEILQVLMADPEHFAGLGHGVGLLEHTLNVTAEAAPKCTPEFRLPLVAALAHDIGKLITFQPDGEGGWIRRGLHSRESARILATLPGFQELPELHQRALILAIKYDHAPSKMPALQGDREASTLGLRIISALSSADKTATAAEKERNLERLLPEDLLWKDFVDFLREAPVVQRGRPGVSNQVNNPPDNPHLFLYEAQWRDAAIGRLPPEVAAALDLTRRDHGKLAKYTRLLAARLRKEGLLVEQCSVVKDGAQALVTTDEGNPLWDIQSGVGEKAVVMRGILVLHADALWKKLNYRIGVKSPYPVTILGPNADSGGRGGSSGGEPTAPADLVDRLSVPDLDSQEGMAALGLEAGSKPVATGNPRARARGAFRTAGPDPRREEALGLAPPAKEGKPASASHEGPYVAPGMDLAPSTGGATETTGTTSPVAVAPPAPTRRTPPAVAETTPTETALADSTAAAMAFIAAGGATFAAESPAEQEGSPVPDAAPEWQDPTDPALAERDQPANAPQPLTQTLPPSTPVPAPAPSDPTTASPPTPPGAPVAPPPIQEVSRAEKREGIAIADANTVAKYPGLRIGDKYYTGQAPVVLSGERQPGSKYKGDSNERHLALSSDGPRRRVRRTT